MEGFILSILILANGLFAMAELAVVSSRRSKLKQRADAGDHGAKAAYELACSPSALLSTVSVAITMIAIFSGAMGGAVLAEPVALKLQSLSLPSAIAHPLALGLVVLVITAVSIIFGELLPKRLASPKRSFARFIASVTPSVYTSKVSPFSKTNSRSPNLASSNTPSGMPPGGSYSGWPLDGIRIGGLCPPLP